jgi:NAD(P)-dependent dehydrogenase (short-subunit alcohol dehydrogenase family)
MTLAIDLTGKIILICGAARGGIGGATARQIAKAGGTIVAVDLTRAALDETVADVAALGGIAHGIVADVMDIDQSEALVSQVIARFGRIDGVANVAGGTTDDEWMPLEDTPTEQFKRTTNLNFDYVFRVCRDAAKAMIVAGHGGSLVNVGSISALTSAPWHGPYGAGKAAIAALTRTMANEWKDAGIRANTVSPGGVLSDRVRAKVQVANVKGGMAEDDFTSTDELANMIVFLLSDLAGGVSGQTIVVDRALSTKFCAGTRKSRAELAAEKS